LDVIVLFFAFGLIAGLLRSELKLPPGLYEGLSLFLLLAIGLKGGQGLAGQPLLPLLPELAGVMLLGVIQTFIAFAVLLNLGRFARPDAASIAAHYGSVSIATFAVAVTWLSSRNIGFEPQLVVYLAVMEVPPILVGIMLVRGVASGKPVRWGDLLHEAFLGKAVTLLLGGMAIGLLAGPNGLDSITPLFFDLFKGVLALFLLEMGLIVSRQMASIKKQGLFLLAFALVMPMFSATLGLLFGWVLGLSVGGLTLLATLAASASYIAVPAAMRLSIPTANQGMSLAAVLGMTFPFNVFIGIPVFYWMAQFVPGA
jgi:hypothetical protein